MDDSDSLVTPSREGPPGSFSVLAHRVVRHSELARTMDHRGSGSNRGPGSEGEALLGCELSIPGVPGYRIREEAVYLHRSLMQSGRRPRSEFFPFF